MPLDNAPFPDAIAPLQQQLAQFRATHPPRTKLPESLWQAAVELARRYGVYAVAHPLRLDYVGLKKRLSGPSSQRRKTPKPAFVELIASEPVKGGDGCVIELESARGGKMRIQWNAAVPLDWTGLLRAWREVEG